MLCDCADRLVVSVMGLAEMRKLSVSASFVSNDSA